MWFQSPAFLKWSRLFHLSEENRGFITSHLGLKEGGRVLDVGCGSGEFTRYIAKDSACEIYGLDIDPGLIRYAAEQPSQDITFVVGDALHLPFPDGFFDAVVSHTFLTSVSDPDAALAEMIRVCCPHGTVASVTPDSFANVPYSPGDYPDYPWLAEYRRLKSELDKRFLKEAAKFIRGKRPEDMPLFFSRSGLESVCVYQIGKFFSLSNGTLDQDQRKEFLELEMEAERSRVSLLDPEDRPQYLRLLEIRKNALLTLPAQPWEWYGGSNLLICGIKRE